MQMQTECIFSALPVANRQSPIPNRYRVCRNWPHNGSTAVFSQHKVARCAATPVGRINLSPLSSIWTN